MTEGRMEILHGELAADGRLVEPDIDSIMERWLDRHFEYRDKNFHVIRSASYQVDDEMSDADNDSTDEFADALLRRGWSVRMASCPTLLF